MKQNVSPAVVIVVIVVVIAIVAAIGYFVLKSRGHKQMPEAAKKKMEEAQRTHGRPGAPAGVPPAGGPPAGPR